MNIKTAKSFVPALISIPTLVSIIMMSACASAQKTSVPITEKVPDGRTPHMPSLKDAEVKALWVPEKIEENRWEEGHYLYVIEKPSTWRVK